MHIAGGGKRELEGTSIASGALLRRARELQRMQLNVIARALQSRRPFFFGSSVRGVATASSFPRILGAPPRANVIMRLLRVNMHEPRAPATLYPTPSNSILFKDGLF